MTSELILLVDDEPSIIQLARMYFERDGFRIQEAMDGEAALEAVAKHHPALIVLDVMLPKLAGFEVCRKLRAGGDLTPVSYTHLTLPTSDLVEISVVAVSLKKKNQTDNGGTGPCIQKNVAAADTDSEHKRLSK